MKNFRKRKFCWSFFNADHICVFEVKEGNTITLKFEVNLLLSTGWQVDKKERILPFVGCNDCFWACHDKRDPTSSKIILSDLMTLLVEMSKIASGWSTASADRSDNIVHNKGGVISW